jgi:hypothetical protein
MWRKEEERACLGVTTTACIHVELYDKINVALKFQLFRKDSRKTRERERERERERVRESK